MRTHSDIPDHEYVPITRPLVGQEEIEAAAAVIRSGWLAQGTRVAAFERLFAAYVGADDAVATSSCTTALHLAILQMAPRPGDEVLVPAFTWVATANAVELAGASPVFVDIDLDTFNIDPQAAAAAVTERTVGMVPVHLFGKPAPMDALMAIAHRHGLWVVEDAACALGTTIGDVHVGTIGDVGCFSFHPRKSISTGEGGMVIAKSSETLSGTRSLRNHGADREGLEASAGDLPDHPVVGFNYRMTDLQAAIGVVQMGRLAVILARRREIAATYDAELAAMQWARPPIPDDGHSYQAYVCMLSTGPRADQSANGPHELRGKLIQHLEQRGIGTRPGTHSPVRLSYYRDKYGLSGHAYPNAIAADRGSVALPLFAGMTDLEIELVVNAVRDARVV